METTQQLGEVRIFLPDASSSYLFINEGLTESFNLETNTETLKLLRKTMRERLDSALYRPSNSIMNPAQSSYVLPKLNLYWI